MNLYELRSIYKPKFIKPVIGVLDELEYDFSYMDEVFKMVRNMIERNIYANLGEWKRDLDETHNPRLNTYIALNNVAFSYLSSGRLHMWRDVLDDRGKDMLELYNFTAKELVQMKYWTKKQNKENMEILKHNIAAVG